ncbi:MAG TPA: sensor histidine kinase [Solirubrobacteraceae bacterium]
MTAPGRHDIFVYDSDGELADVATAFLHDAADERAAAVAVFDARKTALLGEALGPGPDGVTFIDHDAHYTRPEATLATYDATLRRLLRGPATSVRLFGELPRCSTQTDRDRWTAYEAILNRAFSAQPAWIVCGYDAREVSDSMLQAGLRTHPQRHRAASGSSPEYHDPEAVVREVTPPPVPLPDDLAPLAVEDGAGAFRERLAGAMSAAGVTEPRASAMLVAASEVIANARRHGGGVRSMRAGAVDGSFVCELSDHGPGLDDPLAGHLPPRPDADDGAGLWVARQLTDRLELLTSPDGLTVRLWV